MILDGLRVPPFNTTLLGVVRGVADFYGYTYSDATLYGATGHAFLINIHETLCPSGPYCWRVDRFEVLLRNLGISRTDHGFFGPTASADERRDIERTLTGLLDQGMPCGLLNLENQLITGCDDTGLLTTQPWAQVDFPPGHLTWGTWEELGESFHMNLYSFERVRPAATEVAVRESLVCAIDMLARPGLYTDEPYGVGLRAYDKWIGAVESGHGAEHGNWWNATVWAECRARASDYFREIGLARVELAESTTHLADAYQEIANNLGRASNKELGDADKIDLLKATAATEQACLAGLEELLSRLPVEPSSS